MEIKAQLSEEEILDLVKAKFRTKFKLNKTHDIPAALFVRAFTIDGDDDEQGRPRIHYDVTARVSFDDGKPEK
jgi:hypothetical protein